MFTKAPLGQQYRLVISPAGAECMHSVPVTAITGVGLLETHMKVKGAKTIQAPADAHKKLITDMKPILGDTVLTHMLLKFHVVWCETHANISMHMSVYIILL